MGSTLSSPAKKRPPGMSPCSATPPPPSPLTATSTPSPCLATHPTGGSGESPLTATPFAASPERLVALILPNLDARSAIRFMSCCRSFLEAAAAPLLWLPICQRALPRPFPSPAFCLDMDDYLQDLLCLTLSGLDVRKDPLPTWQQLTDLAASLTRMPPQLRPHYQRWGWFFSSLTVNAQERSCTVSPGTTLHIQASGRVFNSVEHLGCIQQLVCALETTSSTRPLLLAAPPAPAQQQQQQQQQQRVLHKHCFYHGVPFRPTPFTATFEMPAPKEGGVYLLCFMNYLQYEPEHALNLYSDSLGERHAAFIISVE